MTRCGTELIRAALGENVFDVLYKMKRVGYLHPA